MTADDAVKLIKSGDRVLIQGGSATPQTLIRAMVARGPELKGVEICHLHTEGECGYTAPELRDSFHTRRSERQAPRWGGNGPGRQQPGRQE